MYRDCGAAQASSSAHDSPGLQLGMSIGETMLGEGEAGLPRTVLLKGTRGGSRARSRLGRMHAYVCAAQSYTKGSRESTRPRSRSAAELAPALRGKNERAQIEVPYSSIAAALLP